jgi:hypothetical protein
VTEIATPGGRRKPELEAVERALAVACVGMSVFPCNAEKRPTCERGFLQAARSPVEVRKLWVQSPGVLVGVPTGGISNLSVVDIDLKHPEAKAWFDSNRLRLGRTRVHRTRSGGLHLLYRYQPGLRCSAGKLTRGVDIRSDGGYIIWWPAHGCEVPNKGDPAPFPGWLWEQLRPPPPQPLPFRAGNSSQQDESAMRGLVRRVACAGQGERNSVLFWAACRAGEHVRQGQVVEGYAAECLLEAALFVGLPRAEVTKTINSGLKTALR